MGNDRRVLVGLSGGIDSALCAALLLENGMEVEAVTFVLWDASLRKLAGDPEAPARDASRVARALGISHHILNISDGFQKGVIDYLVGSYLSGTTPNPCAVCNREVKFRYLLDEADALGCGLVSTGHYARIEGDGPNIKLLRGIDGRRDQSYFLSLLHHERLSRMIFPLGALRKEEVILMAKERALPIAGSESREICFLGDRDYRTYLRRFVIDRAEKGEIVDLAGSVVGAHEGFWNYTVGQRRNIGVPAAEAYYVVGIDAEKNRVIVGFREDVMKREVVAGSFNWISSIMDKKKLHVQGMVRYNQRPAPGTAYIESQDTVRMVFDEPRFAPAPGQVLALFQNDVVVGGGIIQ
jgi:tRNA-specific 2-thiouridylase